MIANQLYAKFDRLSAMLFANGWAFIVPYLLIFILFRYQATTVAAMKTVFIALHVLLAPLFLQHLWKVSRKAELLDFIFWIGLLLLFLLPGAFLEFPSDPWDHFRRIYAWQADRLVSENVTHQFSYFWGWTFIYAVPPLQRRLALGIYAAFWQLLLAFQFYRLSLRLGFIKSWARIQTLATVVLFGVNIFSFYRYYALAATILSYIAYLAALIAVMDFLEGKKKQALQLPLLFLVMAFNHGQELMLFAISTFALLVHYAYEKGKLWRRLVFLLPVVVIASWPLGAWIVRYRELVPVAVWNPGPPYVSSLGIFRIWDLELPYFEVFGIPGLVSLVMALVLFRKYPRLALLTIVPVVLLLFSPFALGFTASLGGVENYITWRPLYAFPFSFMLVTGLKEIFERLTSSGTSRRRTTHLIQASVVSIIVIVSLVPTFPMRGKLWFLLHQPATELSLVQLDQTAQWFDDNYREKLGCLVVGDRATRTVLATMFGLPAVTERLIPRDAHTFIIQYGSFVDHLRTNQVCGFLVANPSQVGAVPVSQAAKLSGHWGPAAVRINLLPERDLEPALSTLTAAGWTRKSVPPFYWLYESPQTTARLQIDAAAP